MSPGVPKFRIVVTGDRHWGEPTQVYNALRHCLAEQQQFLLGVGDCPTGADLMAKLWGAKYLRFPVTQFNAGWVYWDYQGQRAAAGPIRNGFMIDMFRPALVLAFITPGSRGTVNCANYAESQGIEVRRFFGRRGRVSDEPGGVPQENQGLAR